MTIRTPEVSAAARLLQAFLKARTQPITYAHCLDMVALVHGYKNAMHMKEAQAVAASGPVSEEKPFSAFLLFGDENSSTWEGASAAKRRRMVAEGYVFEIAFATEAELNAYLDGVSEGVGWMDYATVEPEEMRRLQCEVARQAPKLIAQATAFARLLEWANAQNMLPANQRDIEAAEAFDQQNAELEWLSSFESLTDFATAWLDAQGEEITFEDSRGVEMTLFPEDAWATLVQRAMRDARMTPTEERALAIIEDELQRLESSLK